MTRPDDIVGYTYKADTYCPDHIMDVMPFGEGGAFDGWALSAPITMPVEDDLTEIAAAFGIDRMDESSFDSDDFPKVIFRDSAEDADDACGVDGMPLV